MFGFLSDGMFTVMFEGWRWVTGWCPKCSRAWCYCPDHRPNRCPDCDHVLATVEEVWVEPMIKDDWWKEV